MRVTLATLELASGSEAPRPTTTSSVSCSATSPAARGERLARCGRRRRAAFSDRGRARGRSRSSRPGCAGLIGVEHGGDVVLGVAGGEQHAGDGEDVVDALRDQPVEPVADDRPGEFEIAVLDRPVRRSASASVSASAANSATARAIAAAMAAEHDADRSSCARLRAASSTRATAMRCERRRASAASAMAGLPAIWPDRKRERRDERQDNDRHGRTSVDREVAAAATAACQDGPGLTPDLGRSQRDRFSPSGDNHPVSRELLGAPAPTAVNARLRRAFAVARTPPGWTGGEQ